VFFLYSFFWPATVMSVIVWNAITVEEQIKARIYLRGRARLERPMRYTLASM
jgi:hypothetical protein